MKTFSEDPLCPYGALNKDNKLPGSYENIVQENTSLKFEVQDLMERNLALQKAFANTGLEVAKVNYVENVTFFV